MVPDLGEVLTENVVRVTETGPEVFSKTETKLWQEGSDRFSFPVESEEGDSGWGRERG